MVVRAGNGLVRSELVGARADRPAAAAAGLSAPGKTADLNDRRERERIPPRARLHWLAAMRAGELVQQFVGQREGLRRQLIGREDGNRLWVAWLRSRTEQVARIFAQQVAMADWHLRESRRLRQRVAEPDAGSAVGYRRSRSHFRAGSRS